MPDDALRSIAAVWEIAMNGIIYIVGLVVVVIVETGFPGFRCS
jgi:hypothetical protein